VLLPIPVSALASGLAIVAEVAAVVVAAETTVGWALETFAASAISVG
jgi:hypothetical protein